jgi:uncharacterized protein YgiM (DUF1202 family)
MRILVWVFSVMVVISHFMATAGFAADREVRWVSASSLNVRAEPTTSSDIKATLGFNLKVLIVDQPEIQANTDGWLWVQSADGRTTGWVSAKYLSREPSKARPGSGARWVTAGTLNVWTTEGDLLGFLNFGSKVFVIGEPELSTSGANRIRVRAADGSIEGWVNTEYLSSKAPTDASSRKRAHPWIQIGTTSDEIARRRGKGSMAPEILGEDDMGLIVKWTYDDEAYVLKRGWQDGTCQYRVVQILPR